MEQKFRVPDLSDPGTLARKKQYFLFFHLRSVMNLQCLVFIALGFIVVFALVFCFLIDRRSG